MPNPLLNTKLHSPPRRPNLVARPRLTERLNEGLTRPLTLISAPPGFGKTTCLTSWLEQPPLPYAWLSLDERDNDLARFLAYLVAALETIQPEVGRQALRRIHSRRMPSVESVMTLLSNDIAAIPHEFILVLDDYHLIELQTIHEAVAFLLDHIPLPMHLVIATRADPPFPLTRLRARNQLVELRAPDLRFSPAEAAAFLNDRMGLNLTPDQISALDGRAEGWIAGLQLAALSMQGREDIAGFIKAFAGDHSFVLEYLAQEVLERQTTEIQTFLLETSILDQMNAALANAITGRTDSAAILARLEKANVFVVPLDDAGHWYRYHHLFDDLLSSRLLQAHSEQLPELHRRASLWYAQNGFPNEAVDHALEVPDFERAARLIEQAAPALLMRSQDRTLRTWLAALPDGLYRIHPALDVWQATALAGAGNFDSAEARLARVDDSRLDPFARQISALMRAAIALFRTDLPHAVESAREALSAAESSLGYPASPEVEFNRVATVWLAMLLAEAEIAAGQLHAAQATLSREFDLGQSAEYASIYPVLMGYVHVRLAELAYELNDLEAASLHAGEGVEITRVEHNEEFESYALIALAQLKQARGDSDAALDLARQAMFLTQRRNVPSELRFVGARYVKLLVQQGRLDAAAQAVEDMPGADGVPWFFQGALKSGAHARVLIARGDFVRAVPELELLEKRLAASGETRMLIEVLALLALARHGAGDVPGAEVTLRRALTLSEPEGYMRTFVDLGAPLKFMISDFRLKIEHQLAADYADKLLAAFPDSEDTDHKSEILSHKSDMVLSERELMVLRLIAEGLSNQEIADRLVVAVSTVKTHINNIYSKLGAASRTQALVRARDRKLI